MTYHHTSRATLQYVASRARRRADGKIHSRYRWKRIHDQDAYDKAIAFNEVHGIGPPNKIRDPALNAILHMAGDPYTSKRYAKANPITLANMAEPDMKQKQPAIIDEYAEAEDRMRERCKRAVDMLVFGIEELSQTASAGNHEQSLINQGYMVTTIHRLCAYARIPIPDLSFRQKHQRLQNKKCTNCGCKIYSHDTDTCVDCSINLDMDELQLIGRDRREREEADKQIRKLKKTINNIEKKVRGHDDDGGTD